MPSGYCRNKWHDFGIAGPDSAASEGGHTRMWDKRSTEWVQGEPTPQERTIEADIEAILPPEVYKYTEVPYHLERLIHQREQQARYELWQFIEDKWFATVDFDNVRHYVRTEYPDAIARESKEEPRQ